MIIMNSTWQVQLCKFVILLLHKYLEMRAVLRTSSGRIVRPVGNIKMEKQNSFDEPSNETFNSTDMYKKLQNMHKICIKIAKYAQNMQIKAHFFLSFKGIKILFFFQKFKKHFKTINISFLNIFTILIIKIGFSSIEKNTKSWKILEKNFKIGNFWSKKI